MEEKKEKKSFFALEWAIFHPSMQIADFAVCSIWKSSKVNGYKTETAILTTIPLSQNVFLSWQFVYIAQLFVCNLIL